MNNKYHYMHVYCIHYHESVRYSSDTSLHHHYTLLSIRYSVHDAFMLQWNLSITDMLVEVILSFIL